MKIYYATSISGMQSKSSDEDNIKLIEHLKNFGEVLTEHFANPAIKNIGETEISNKKIHDRDMDWLMTADVIVAEVSNPSLGVGYEIGRAVEHKKKILCLRRKSNNRLSAMIAGCENLILKEYESLPIALNEINAFFSEISA